MSTLSLLNARYMSKRISGSSCKSASIIPTQSPDAKDKPAEIAFWWPKLRVNTINLTDGSSLAHASMNLQLASVEPSLTKSSSQCDGRFRTFSNRWRNNGNTWSSLRKGITMLNSDRVIMLCYFRSDYKSLGSRPILRKMTADQERVNKRIFSDAGCIWTRGKSNARIAACGGKPM